MDFCIPVGYLLISSVRSVLTLLKVPRCCLDTVRHFPEHLCHCIPVRRSHCHSITALQWNRCCYSTPLRLGKHLLLCQVPVYIPAAVCYRGGSLGILSINTKQDKCKYTFVSSWCATHSEIFIILLCLHKQKMDWLQITARNTAARYVPGARPCYMLTWQINWRESSLAAIQPLLAAVPQKRYRSLLCYRKSLSIRTISNSLTAFSSCFTLWYFFFIFILPKSPE